MSCYFFGGGCPLSRMTIEYACIESVSFPICVDGFIVYACIEIIFFSMYMYENKMFNKK